MATIEKIENIDYRKLIIQLAIRYEYPLADIEIDVGKSDVWVTYKSFNAIFASRNGFELRVEGMFISSMFEMNMLNNFACFAYDVWVEVERLNNGTSRD